MDLIKSDLNKLGIKHDIFFLKSLLKRLVNKSIKQLKSDKFVDKEFYLLLEAKKLKSGKSKKTSI